MRLKVMQLPVRTYPGRAPYAVVLGEGHLVTESEETTKGFTILKYRAEVIS